MLSLSPSSGHFERQSFFSPTLRVSSLLLSLPSLFLAEHDVTGMEYAFGYLGSLGLAVLPLNFMAIPTLLIRGHRRGKKWERLDTVEAQFSSNQSIGVLRALFQPKCHNTIPAATRKENLHPSQSQYLNLTFTDFKYWHSPFKSIFKLEKNQITPKG